MDQLRIKGFMVGEWRVEPHLNHVVNGEEKRRLESRSMAVLVHLANHPNTVISREELLLAVWGNCFVTENTLSQTISRLRRALGDDWQSPEYLETISKIGYRLIAPVVPFPEQPGLVPPKTKAQTSPPKHTYFIGGGILVAMVLGALLWVMFKPINEPPIAFTTTPAITLVGRQANSVLSPDGKHIAFAWEGFAKDNWDVYLKTIGADNPHRLTLEPGPDVLPAWSSDGSKIAFISGGDGCGIFEMPFTGGPRVKLAECLPNIRHLQWSPDGHQLVLDALDETTQLQTIFLLNLKNGERQRLTKPNSGERGDWSPSFSPDQSQIAFIRKETRDRHNIHLLSLADGTSKPVTQHRGGRLRGVDWTADGKSVIYSYNHDGGFALWKLDLDSGQINRLPIHDEWVTYPSIARQGQALIYKNYADVVDLWQVSLGDEGLPSGEPQAIVPSTRSDLYPRLSPKDDRLSFVSNRSGSFEIWTGEISGGNLIRHTELNGGSTGMIDWSPDGSELVYQSGVDGQSDLYIIQANGTQKRPLTATSWDEINARFSRNGDRIYYASNATGDWQIWYFDSRDQQSQQMTQQGGFFAQEGPESRFVYFTRLNQNALFRMPINGGEPEEMWQGLGLADWGNWQISKNGLYYIDRSANALMLQPFSGEPKRKILQGERTFPYLGPSFHIPDDGAMLYFSQITHSDDEIKLVTMK